MGVWLYVASLTAISAALCMSMYIAYFKGAGVGMFVGAAVL